MKIAVPTRENVVDDHFGHCAYYTLFTVDDDKNITNIETLLLHKDAVVNEHCFRVERKRLP